MSIKLRLGVGGTVPLKPLSKDTHSSLSLRIWSYFGMLQLRPGLKGNRHFPLKPWLLLEGWCHREPRGVSTPVPDAGTQEGLVGAEPAPHTGDTGAQCSSTASSATEQSARRTSGCHSEIQACILSRNPEEGRCY